MGVPSGPPSSLPASYYVVGADDGIVSAVAVSVARAVSGDGTE